jgi:ketosteroid isomerase-like protein
MPPRASSFVALAAAALVACHTGVGGHLSEGDKDAIRRTTADAVQLALSPRADAETYVKLYYAPDAIVQPPNAPALSGRDNLKSFFASYLPMKLYKATIETIEGRNDLAYVRGRYEMEWATAAGSGSDRGKYVEIWKKQPGGAWQVAVDTFNSDLPLPGLLLPVGQEKKDASPELRRLGYLVGQWAFEGEAKPGPLGPGGAFNGRIDCRWYAGGGQVVCSSDGGSPSGPTQVLELYGWDRESRAYTYAAIDSQGFTVASHPTVRDRTWTVVVDVRAGGKPLRIRSTTVEESPTSMSFGSELSTAGGAFVPVSSGKARKTS